MKSNNILLACALAIGLAVLAVAAGWLPHDILPSLGLLGLAGSMTPIEEIADIIKKQGDAQKAWHATQGARIDELSESKQMIEDFMAKMTSPGGGGSSRSGFDSGELKALSAGVRALLSGQQEKANQLFVEAKGLIAGSGPDGGYVVHNVISSGMTKVMAELSPLYKLARKIPMTTGGTFEEPIDREAAAADWVGETTARNDTATPKLGLLAVPLNEICAMPKASQTLIDTAGIDVLAWLSEKVGTAFAVKESAAFHDGNGVAKPRGILTYATAATADDTRAWGTIEHVITGANGAFDTTKADPLQDLVATLKPQYRAGAVWLMNRKTANAIRKLKEATSDAYIWQPGLTLGQPDALLGYRVAIDEDMPDMDTGSLSIAFGDFAKAYTIVEQPGAKFLTDPYTDKPNVRLFAYRRVGGAMNNSEALKFLKFSVA